jgi:hypothetical protein
MPANYSEGKWNGMNQTQNRVEAGSGRLRERASEEDQAWSAKGREAGEEETRFFRERFSLARERCESASERCQSASERCQLA